MSMYAYTFAYTRVCFLHVCFMCICIYVCMYVCVCIVQAYALHLYKAQLIIKLLNTFNDDF